MLPPSRPDLLQADVAQIRASWSPRAEAALAEAKRECRARPRAGQQRRAERAADQPVHDRRGAPRGAPGCAARAGARQAPINQTQVLAPDRRRHRRQRHRRRGAAGWGQSAADPAGPAGMSRAEVPTADLARLDRGCAVAILPARRRSPARCAWSRRRWTRRRATAIVFVDLGPCATRAHNIRAAANSSSAAPWADVAAERRAAARRFPATMLRAARLDGAQDQVDGRPALWASACEITGGLDADARVVASGGGFAERRRGARGGRTGRCGAGTPAAAAKPSGGRDERLRLVDPQSPPASCCS